MKNAIQRMSLRAQRIGFSLLFVCALSMMAETLLSITPLGPRALISAPCAAPEYSEFDFWLGDWDAFDVDNPGVKIARTRVDRILNGCVLGEVYEGTDGHEGQSFSIYDMSRKVWHQSWVTNRGELLVIEGKIQAGEMVLSGVDHPVGVQERHVRGTWKPVGGGVREVAIISTDGGKGWKPWFDLMFRPHKP